MTFKGLIKKIETYCFNYITICPYSYKKEKKNQKTKIVTSYINKTVNPPHLIFEKEKQTETKT